MEEKRPGQMPESDSPVASDATQNQSARIGGEAAGSDDATDRERIRAAAARGAALKKDLEAGGFGDHKGVEGFPGIHDQ